MIANVSPSCMCYEETHNTLKYASRAKNIRRRVVKNTVAVQAHISQVANAARAMLVVFCSHVAMASRLYRSEVTYVFLPIAVVSHCHLAIAAVQRYHRGAARRDQQPEGAAARGQFTRPAAARDRATPRRFAR